MKVIFRLKVEKRSYPSWAGVTFCRLAGGAAGGPTAGIQGELPRLKRLLAKLTKRMRRDPIHGLCLRLAPWGKMGGRADFPPSTGRKRRRWPPTCPSRLRPAGPRPGRSGSEQALDFQVWLKAFCWGAFRPQAGPGGTLLLYCYSCSSALDSRQHI